MNIRTKKRVTVTPDLIGRLRNGSKEIDVSRLARKAGLPYALVYNVSHGRVKSISPGDYRRLFGEEPAVEPPDRTDGGYFRAMVRLWLYLDRRQSKRQLYRDFFQSHKHIHKTDYRIFTGEIDSVELRVEQLMERKFLDQGLDRETIHSWIKELDIKRRQPRIPYSEVRDHLRYIQQTVAIHPSRLLKQSRNRYESGRLRTVSRKTADRIIRLRKEIEKHYAVSRRVEKERVRETVYGGREGYVPYREVREMLFFLRDIGGQYPKQFLGRGIGAYEQKRIKRIAAWRATRIRRRCEQLIHDNPQVRLADLPEPYRTGEIGRLIDQLRRISIQHVCGSYDEAFENGVLEQLIEAHGAGYDQPESGLVRFDEAARYLQMKPKAFDYFVARHNELFKKIAVRKDTGWYLPRLYLHTLKSVAGFRTIKGKYNFLSSHEAICQPLQKPSSVESISSN